MIQGPSGNWYSFVEWADMEYRGHWEVRLSRLLNRS